ncbi:PepSY domain-containing protein [Neobacillus sp. YIM B02564]|uniref:PepSY domain-containing protein n=1 Tax=Neobacillus paridis TaxID=2803862 RepID=A0ABS1TNK1_9BACI|nr:PepSY domain-containing protein [Neobacillus paridis]MBL4952812.1 PepSY domain-containing protein [Neobacillus paridis]
MKRIILLTVLLLPVSFGGFFHATYADTGHLEKAENKRITEKQAEEIALKKVKGEVVRVKLETDDGREYYEVIIQSSGTVYEVEVDAKTGQVVEVEKEGSHDGHHDDHDDDDGHDDDDHMDD